MDARAAIHEDGETPIVNTMVRLHH